MNEREQDRIGALCRSYLILYKHKHKRAEVERIINQLHQATAPPPLEIYVSEEIEVEGQVA